MYYVNVWLLSQDLPLSHKYLWLTKESADAGLRTGRKRGLKFVYRIVINLKDPPDRPTHL